MKNNDEFHFISESELRQSRIFYEMHVSPITKKALLIIFFIFTILTVYVLFAPYNVILTAQAKIRPVEDTVYITPLVSGLLKEKKFITGEKIQKGQILYVIDNDFIQKSIISSKKRKTDIISMIRQDENILSALKEYECNGKISEIYLDDSQNILKNEILKLEEEYKNAENNFNVNSVLYPGAISKVALDDYKKAMNIAHFNLKSYISTQKKIYTEEKKSLTLELADLESSLAKLTSDFENTVIKSPIDGYIEETQIINEGESVIAECQIAKIIPESEDNLKVYIFVMIDDIADLQTGMSFSICFPKYPSSEYAGITGTIIYIPKDSKTDESGNYYYQVTGVLDTNKLIKKRDNSTVFLVAGMSGKCKILTRTEPLYIFLLQKMGFMN